MIVFCVTISGCCNVSRKPRPQVAYCWRNIDYRMFHFGQNPTESHCAHFFSHPFLSQSLRLHTSIHHLPFLSALSFMHLLSKPWALRTFPPNHDPPSSRRILFSRCLRFAVVNAETGENRETYHRWKEVWRRCGTHDWTLWALTPVTGAPRFLLLNYRTQIEVNTLWDNWRDRY